MKNTFLNFINEKYSEAEGKPMNYEQECSFIGTHPITTRQPPSYHAMLTVLEKYIPCTSRGEIIYTALESAYSVFAQQDSEQSSAFRYYRAALTAYNSKVMRDVTTREAGQMGFFVSPDYKERAELLLAALKDDRSIDDIEAEFADFLNLHESEE